MHPSTRPGTAIAACLALLAPSIAVAGTAPPQAAPYAAMAPIAAYRMASQADEIALARSAAPPSIADAAEVLTLGPLGYEAAAKGTNGFVCIVERAWASDFDDAGFWNPKNRAPNCFNPAAVRSVLPTYLERTRWVLAGASKAEMIARTMAAIAAGRIGPPEAGAMCFMMSKDQYLGDGPGGGHWHPHLMVFLPRQAGRAPDWGANLPGSPVFGDDGGLDPAAVYFIPVGRWSDGTAAAMPM